MTPEVTATATAGAVSSFTSNFMLDGDTYKRGAELGFDGVDFYTAGRGGVLGEVAGDVVAAAFVFFNPESVRATWERTQPVLPRAATAAEFAACLHRWTDRLTDDVDWARLAELTGTVVANANPAAAPIFAAWRGLDEPADPKQLAAHRMNALRELRMALHGAAVVAAGLRPVEALAIKTPYMATIFGWTDGLPEVDGLQPAWDAAETATNNTFGMALAVLDASELDTLAKLCDAAVAAVG